MRQVHDSIDNAIAEAFRYKKRAARLRKTVVRLKDQLQVQGEEISELRKEVAGLREFINRT